jgi:hypothetical protein
MARALIYVGLARGRADERGFSTIRQLRRQHPRARQLTLEDFKQLVREQYFMLLIDREAALAALPGLLPTEAGERGQAFELLCRVLTAAGPLTGAAAEKLEEVGALFNLEPSTPPPSAAEAPKRATAARRPAARRAAKSTG